MADFYNKISNKDLSISEVSKSAFTQARKKLKETAFIELSQKAVAKFYEQAPYKTWGKHRVLACDGSTIQLPNSKDIQDEFPTKSFGPNADKERSIARVSLIYDVFNQITLSAKLGTYTSHESTLLKEQLPELKFMKNDLLLLDRGYPSFNLLFELIQMKLNFCVRLKDNWWKEVIAMFKAEETDKLVTFQLPEKDKKIAEKYEQSELDFKVRIVIVELENGQKEVLCTNLLHAEEYDLEDLHWLYHQRWGIEETYKILKSRINVENFSGLTALSVKQDFFASIFVMNLTAILAYPISEKIAKEDKQQSHKKKRKRKLNRTNTISFFKESIVAIFIKKKIDQFLDYFDRMTQKTTEIIRTERKFERKHKPKRPKSMNYKDM